VIFHEPAHEETQMRCANSTCRKDAQDVSRGSLHLLEMELPPDERVVRADSGFPILAAPVRFFWLCAECSRLYRLKRWTAAGLILEPILEPIVKTAAAGQPGVLVGKVLIGPHRLLRHGLFRG